MVGEAGEGLAAPAVGEAVAGLAAPAVGEADDGCATGFAAGVRIRIASSRLVVPSRTRNSADSCMPGNLCFMREEL